MLSVEQEPIRLPSILSEVEGPEGRVVHFSKHRRLTIPPRFQFLWEQTRIGASIYDLSLRLRARGGSSRIFLEVASYLCFLVDNDLIDDIRVVRLVDSIRGEYEWPEDLIASASVSGSAMVWARRDRPAMRGGAPIPFYSRSFDLLASALSLLTLVCAVILLVFLFDPGEVRNAGHAGVVFLIGFLAAGILGRTFAAIFRAVASVLGGDGGELSWKFDLLGPHLTFDPHTVTGAYRRFADFTMTFGSTIAPVVVMLLARPSYPGNLIALAGALFVVALSTHPATRSDLTRSLRVWNRTPTSWREDEELREVESFHRFGGFSSVGIAAIFFSMVVLGLLKVRLDAQYVRTHLTSSVVFAATFLMSIVAYIEPFFRNELVGAAARNRRRRLWATPAKVLSVAASDREAWNNLPVLRQLTTPLRKQLISAARVVEFRVGQPIFRQGDTNRSLFVVLSGKLAVAKSFEGRRRKVVALLSGGAVFGETAFFFGQPRSADVVATEDSRLLEIPYLPSMRDLDLSSSDEFQFRVWLLQALSGNPMLQDLPSEAMDTLIFAGTRKTFRVGEVVFTEGAPASTCYFIAQGRASVLKQARKIAELGAGDAFGEIALLKPGMHRTATVVADSDLLCMELEIDAFWALLAARLPLGAEIERLALRRLNLDQERLARS